MNFTLKFSGSYRDRLKRVGIVSSKQAAICGLVGPVSRASGISRDLRKVLPYSGYEKVRLTVPTATEGDGYNRVQIFFDEAEQSANIIQQMAMSLPLGPVACSSFKIPVGDSLGWVEAPGGASFHWVSCGEDEHVVRYHVTPPSCTNWQGFQLAALNSAYQNLPIMMATFGISDAERDR